MDNRQYRQIVDDYADMVYRIALNQTRRVPDAEDVVQAVFLKLYEKPPTWLGNGLECDGGRAMAAGTEREPARDERLRAWLIRVTVNECKSLWPILSRPASILCDIRSARRIGWLPSAAICVASRGRRRRRRLRDTFWQSRLRQLRRPWRS